MCVDSLVHVWERAGELQLLLAQEKLLYSLIACISLDFKFGLPN